MAEGKGKAALLLLLLVGGGAAAVAYSKNASAAPATGCRWQRRDNGTVNPGDYFALAFDAPPNWTDADVATFKLSMSALGFDQTQYAQGAPVPPPYQSARGVSMQGRYIGSRTYDVSREALGKIPVAVLILVGCPQPGIAPPPAPRPQPNPAGSFPQHSPAQPGDRMAAGCDPLPDFLWVDRTSDKLANPGDANAVQLTAADLSDDDPRSPYYLPTLAAKPQSFASLPLNPGLTPRMLPPQDPRSAFFNRGGGQPAPDPYHPNVSPGPVDAMFATAKGFPPRRRG